MQLTIDLTNQPPAYGKRVIAMIEAFYGLPQTVTTTAESIAFANTVSIGPDAEINSSASKVIAWDSVCKQLTETCPGWEGLGASGIDAACAAIRLLKKAAATGPLVQPAAIAPSTVAADPQPTAPVAPPASSPEPSVPPVPAVPPVPTATAPTAPVTPSSPAGVVLDTDGLPWDARIHSSSKAKNADGRWRAKKGLNDGGLVARVQAELRAVMAVPARGEIGSPEMNAALEADAQKLIAMGVDPLTGEVFASTPAVMPPVPEAPAVATPFVPPPPPVMPIPASAAPVVPAVPVTVPGAQPDPTTMPELMPRVTGAMATGQIPPTAMLDACKAVGLPDLPSLAHRPDLIPQVWAMLKARHQGVWA